MAEHPTEPSWFGVTIIWITLKKSTLIDCFMSEWLSNCYVILFRYLENYRNLTETLAQTHQLWTKQ